MNSIEIVVTVVAAMLAGIGLCLLAVFCVAMLKMMSTLQESAKLVVEAAKQIPLIMASVDRNFGEGSPTARAAKSVSSLSENLPMLIAGMKGFSDTMSVFFKAAFQEREVEKIVSPLSAPAEEFTGQIPYSEEAAAQYEQSRAAKAQRLELSKEEMAGMRTDKEPPEPAAEPEVEGNG